MEIECAHCGNKQLAQIPGTWTPIAMGEEGPIAGPAIPLVMMGCTKCGFMMMFSPQAVAPAPWPETKPEQ